MWRRNVETVACTCFVKYVKTRFLISESVFFSKFYSFPKTVTWFATRVGLFFLYRVFITQNTNSLFSYQLIPYANRKVLIFVSVNPWWESPVNLLFYVQEHGNKSNPCLNLLKSFWFPNRERSALKLCLIFLIPN